VLLDRQPIARFEQAQLGRVQADGRRYIDVVKLMLAAGGRTDVPCDDALQKDQGGDAGVTSVILGRRPETMR
jgi:hypothetical protein